MLPAWFIFVAITIRIYGGFGYIWGVLKGKAKPNPITWFIWGLTPMIAFAAQLQEGVGYEAWMTFALGAGPLCVFLLSLFKSRSSSHFTVFNIGCGVIALFGIVLWQLTNNPLLAIVFSIVADIFASIPTIRKGYRHPHSEYALPYLLSIISMIITLLTVSNWTFATYAFPLYMLLINLVLFTSITLGGHKKHWRWR